jgi:hypothetical protein
MTMEVLTKEKVFSNIDLTQKLVNAGVAIDGKILQGLDFDREYLEQETYRTLQKKIA